MASRMASARHKGDGGKEEPGVTGRGSQTARSPSSPLVPSPTRPRAAPARQHQGRRVSQRSKARCPSPAAGSPPASKGPYPTLWPVSLSGTNWCPWPHSLDECCQSTDTLKWRGESQLCADDGGDSGDYTTTRI